MNDSALTHEMAKCTGMLFFGMKASHKPLKSIMHGGMHILNYLVRNDGPMTPGELSTGMDASSARIAISLRNLEKSGFIARDIDKSDRRKILVTITEDGREIVRKSNDEIMNRMALIIGEIGEKDAREYIRIVSRIVDVMQKL